MVPLSLSTPQDRQARFASIAEISTLLGLPRSTMYERAKRRAIPGVVRVGQRILIDLTKLEPWLEAGGDIEETEGE